MRQLECGKAGTDSQAVLRDTPDSGFSLLEVLIATIIISLTLMALLQLLLVGFKAKISARQRTGATICAEKILQEYISGNKCSSGKYQGELEGFQYRIQIEPQYEIPTNEANTKIRCYLIQVNITWLEKEKTKSFALQTFRTVVQRLPKF
jgi:prepilin-type N-terminal cleavage/methylation domain-containing protein